MKISVIIVNYRTPELTIECIRSLKLAGHALEIVVVDNCSNDGSEARIAAACPDVRLISSSKNTGFAGGCRLGVESSTGEYLAFINSDCRAEPGALDTLADYLDKHSEISVAVPRLLESDGRIQHNVAQLPNLKSIAAEYLLGKVSAWYLDLGNWVDPTPVESFSGAALMIRRSDYLAAGGFPERYFMYVEDVELSYQLGRIGKVIAYLPQSVITHHGGGSSSNGRKALNKMMHRHRRNYAWRHLPWPANALAASTIWLGLGIMRLKYAAKNLLHRRYSG